MPLPHLKQLSLHRFWANKGAVAGVFTLIGLAVISITLWVIFFLQRRRRSMTRQHEENVSATLQAVYGRTAPLEDESDSSLSSRRSRNGSARRLSILPVAYNEDRTQYVPYSQHAAPFSPDAYHDIPSPTSPQLNVPPPSAFRDRPSGDGVGMAEIGNGSMGTAYTRHSQQSSRGSLEPLLASYQRRGGPLSPTYGPHNRHVPNGRSSRTPSTEKGYLAGMSRPSYPQSPPNFYATNATSRSALLANGPEEQVNLVNADQKQNGDLGDAEVSVEDELRRPILAVCDIRLLFSTTSCSPLSFLLGYQSTRRGEHTVAFITFFLFFFQSNSVSNSS